MNKPFKNILIGMTVCCVLMFAWIGLAVWLTGGREIEQFSQVDMLYFCLCMAAELATIIALFILAVKLGKVNHSPQRTVSKPNKLGGLLLVCAIIAGFLSALAGILLMNQQLLSVRTLKWLLVIFCALPPVLALCNVVCVAWNRRRLQRMNVQQMQRYILSHREQAKKTAEEKMRFLRRWLRLTDLYTVVLALVALGIGVLGGMLHSGSSVPFQFYAALIYLAAFSRLRTGVPESELLEEKTAIDPADYPQLYALTRDAAEKSGYHGTVRIVLTDNCTAGISAERTRCCLYLGVTLLCLFSEQEVFCILLHEFSHAVQQERSGEREAGYSNWLLRGGNPHFSSGLTNLLFCGWETVYLLQYDLYRYAATIDVETTADAAMGSLGDPKAAASSLMKLHYARLYDWEQGTEDHPSFFAPEKLNGHFLHDQIQQLEAAIAQRKEAWDRLIAAEILSRNASHPTTKMRLESLGVSEYETLEKNHSPVFAAEVEKAVTFVESTVCRDLSDAYAENREKAYLEPLETVEAWEQAGKPMLPETYADVNTALRQLGKHAEADRLAQQAIDTFTGDAASYAWFIRGCYLLHRYDPAGLAYVYRAIEENHNFIEEGLEVIGEFCCLVGDQQELDSYREKAMELAQKERDLYSQLDHLSKSDNLTQENLPEPMRTQILDFIRRVENGTLERVYLVRKSITEDFFTSVFVLRFCDGKNPENDKVYHKIFRYLDAQDWQFTLLYYENVKNVPFDRIPGSCVYEKDAARTGNVEAK